MYLDIYIWYLWCPTPISKENLRHCYYWQLSVGILISCHIGENLRIVYIVKQKMAYSKILPIKILGIAISHIALHCFFCRFVQCHFWSIASARIIQNLLWNLWFPVTIGHTVIAIFMPWYPPNEFVRMIEGISRYEKNRHFFVTFCLIKYFQLIVQQWNSA